ncbi:DNA polymerase III, subunit gamma and tau, partial [bacterium (Candidatus Moisslbacteria) CG_4_10_14_0_2_um_filter_36_61]
MVLYRKYRPQKFSELIGEKEIITILQNEIKQEKTAHAYLFAGPRGVGKTTMARILAKAVNCANRKKGEAEPCDQCLSCQEIAQGKSFDLIEIDAASNRGINEIRELKERIRFLPSLSRFRVFIIDEVHMLTPEAFNALLKTLEEPPSYVLFILATTKIHELPETIISRCQVFKFTKIPLEEIVDYLKEIAKKEGVKISEEVLKIIAFRSEGCARDAMSLLGQIIALGDKEITLEEAMLVLPPSQLNLVIDLLDLLIKKEAKG